MSKLDERVRYLRETIADAHMNYVKSILGVRTILDAPPEQDWHENTDLIIPGPLRVAVRMRDPQFESFVDDFTIRESRPISKLPTELEKLTVGNYGDLLFYGFANKTNSGIGAWTLADLNVFRAYHDRVRHQRRKHGDGSATFRAYRWDTFPPEFIIAHRR